LESPNLSCLSTSQQIEIITDIIKRRKEPENPRKKPKKSNQTLWAFRKKGGEPKIDYAKSQKPPFFSFYSL
jgi:hypothetical protein